MASAKTIERKLLRSPLKGSVMPNYSGFGLVDVPHTILKGFGFQSERGLTEFDNSLFSGAKRVVLLTLDGFGWNLLKQTKLLKQMEGFPITSVAPSTTPVALPTLSTGLTPQEHGLVGFWVYLRELGDVVSMLRFGPAGEAGSYQDAGIAPEIFFPRETLYTRLKSAGMKSIVVNRQDCIESAFSSVYNGAEQVPYMNTADLFVKARKVCSGKGLIHLYWEMVDMSSHIFGTKSDEVKAQIAALEWELDSFFRKLKDALVIVTADHGQIDLPFRKERSFLGHPELLSMLSSPPSGEARLVYLFAKRGKREQVHEYLRHHFSRMAWVCESGELLAQGLFGAGKPLPETRERLGDFTLIAKGDYRFSYPFAEGRGVIGFHGGLSKEEMLVPLLWKRI